MGDEKGRSVTNHPMMKLKLRKLGGKKFCEKLSTESGYDYSSWYHVKSHQIPLSTGNKDSDPENG